MSAYRRRNRATAPTPGGTHRPVHLPNIEYGGNTAGDNAIAGSLGAWPPIDDSIFDNSLYRTQSALPENNILFDPTVGFNHAFKPLPSIDPLGLDYLGLDLDNPISGQWTGAFETGRASTCSPPSTSSLASSGGSLFSAVHTELPLDGQTITSTWSRAPSPLRQIVAEQKETQTGFVCLGPRCEETFGCEDDLNKHIKTLHAHVCNWAGCEHPGFSSKDGMIWHVKAEHLIICPGPGCTESSFQNKSLLESHIRVAHPGERKVYTGEAAVSDATPTPMLPILSSQGNQDVTSKPYTPGSSSEDRKLKEYAVTVSKRKCREQLKNVVEKKSRRQAGMRGLHVLNFPLNCQV
jgi:hypothetical protein